MPENTYGGFRAAARSVAPVRNARAEAAYAEEFAKWQGLIEAVSRDPNLTPDQRAAAIASLRDRQQAEAGGIRRRVMEEERQIEKAGRRAERRLRRHRVPKP